MGAGFCLQNAFGGRLRQDKCSACPTRGWVNPLPRPCKYQRHRRSPHCGEMWNLGVILLRPSSPKGLRNWAEPGSQNLGEGPCPSPHRGTQGLQRGTGAISGVLLNPADELLLWHDHPAAYFQYREAWLVHQLVSAGWGHTQHLCHHLRIEEQRQLAIAPVLRCYHCSIPPFRNVSSATCIRWFCSSRFPSECGSACRPPRGTDRWYTSDVRSWAARLLHA